VVASEEPTTEMSVNPTARPKKPPRPSTSPTAYPSAKIEVAVEKRSHNILELTMKLTPDIDWPTGDADRKMEEKTWEEVTAKQIKQQLELENKFTDIDVQALNVTVKLIHEKQPNRVIRRGLGLVPAEYILFNTTVWYYVRTDTDADALPVDEDVQLAITAAFDSQKVGGYLAILKKQHAFNGVKNVELSAQPEFKQSHEIKQLTMELCCGIKLPLTTSAKEAFEEATAEQIKKQLEKDGNLQGAKDLVVIVNMLDRRRLGGRGLESDSPSSVSFDAIISYYAKVDKVVDDDSIDKDMRSAIATAFDSTGDGEVSVEKYITKLSESITGVTRVKVSAMKNISPVKGPEKDIEGFGNTALIASGVAGVCAALLIGYFGIRYVKGSDESIPAGDSIFGDDDASSLAGDTSRQGEDLSLFTRTEGFSLKGQEFSGGNTTITDSARSKNTEFTYSEAYDPNAQNRNSNKNHGAPIPLQGLSPQIEEDVADDASFEFRYHNRFAESEREELLQIFAPPGKLGVVIDTPDEDAPVVHAIKESSPLIGKLLVGDKLVAIDDDDVKYLSAIEVSKIISRKSNNLQRKFTIVRINKI